MNAHAQAYMDETPISVKRALDDAIAIYGNPDGADRSQCVEQIIRGRPAFWTSASHHDQRALGLRYSATQTGSVVDAMHSIYPEHRKQQREAALDTLIPLDWRAVNSLALAYAECGVWRDDAELARRRERDTRRAA